MEMSSEAPVVASESHLQPPSQAQPTISSKPRVSIQPGSHLDPGAYVRGTFEISIGQNVLVHPRAHLLSIHAPLIIGDGCVISEKCVVGGPLPSISPTDKLVDATKPERHSRRTVSASLRATMVEDLVHLHPNVTIGHGATIRASSIIESNAVIESHAVVGAHSKICSNTTIINDVPDWMVIWGSGSIQAKRKRTTQFPGLQGDAYELVEQARIAAMERERDGTINVLKATAAKSLSSKNKK